MLEPWTRHLPPDVRQRLVELHRIEPRRNLRIAIYLGLWLGAALLATAVPSLWVRLPCWVLIGLCLHGLGDFMHMCSHGRVFGMGLVDRVVGFLCGLPVLLSCSNYRANHLLHHAHLNTERDPDCLYNLPYPALRKLIYRLWFVAGLPIYAVRVALTGPAAARGLAEKVACLAETAAMVGFYTWLFPFARGHGLMPLVVQGWLLALPFAMLVANARGLAEHTMLDRQPPPDPFHDARTTLSNRIVSFFFNNQNYHLEHHLFPSVPWHNLPEVHRLLKPIYEAEQASVARSYLEFVRDGLHLGPECRLRYGADGQGRPVSS